MRISDWSSDVCSSDLINLIVVIADQPRSLRHQQDSAGRAIIDILGDLRGDLAGKVGSQAGDQRGRYDVPGLQHTLGCAPCRDGVCQTVSISVVSQKLKKE